MAGEASDGNHPSTPDSPTSAGFNTDQLPLNTNTSRTSEDYSDDEAAVDPHIIHDEGDAGEAEEDEEEGEDLFNDNYME